MRHLLLILALAGCASATGNDCTRAVGDVDGDGTVAPADASLTLDAESADWDGDGEVTPEDAEGIFAFWLEG